MRTLAILAAASMILLGCDAVEDLVNSATGEEETEETTEAADPAADPAQNGQAAVPAQPGQNGQVPEQPGQPMPNGQVNPNGMQVPTPNGNVAINPNGVQVPTPNGNVAINPNGVQVPGQNGNVAINPNGVQMPSQGGNVAVAPNMPSQGGAMPAGQVAPQGQVFHINFSGATERIQSVGGSGRDLSSFGSSCWGNAPQNPQFTLQVPSQQYVGISAQASDGTDLVMAVVGQNGAATCNDDYHGLQPGVAQVFAPGVYQIFVGPYSNYGNAQAPFTLTVTANAQEYEALGSNAMWGNNNGMGDLAELEQQLAQLEQELGQLGTGGGAEAEALAELFGQMGQGGQFDPNAMGGLFGGSLPPIAQGGTPAMVAGANLTVPANTAPGTVSGNAGGTTQGSTFASTCWGNYPAAPQHQVTVQADQNLTFRVASSADTTIAIQSPTGQWFCNDDAEGLNAGLHQAFGAGTYNVYVGTYSGGSMAPYTLTVSR